MRTTWDKYFIQIAIDIGKRSTCVRRQIGALLVRDNRILSSGYNGAPKGQAHCLDIGCLRNEQNIESGTRHEICRAIHAEQNAIIQAAFHGVCTDGATLYCETFPCSICAKMLINAGIIRIVYSSEYTDMNAWKFLEDSHINIERIDL